MEGPVQEFYSATNGFMLNRHHSELANPNLNGSSDIAGKSTGGVGAEMDFSGAVLKYISQMLMEEEDLENRPCMLHDCTALQATEKYFSDVLHGSESFTSASHSSISSSDPNDSGGFSDSKGKRNFYSDIDDDSVEKQRNKQLAAYKKDETESLEEFSEVLLCSTHGTRKKDDGEAATAVAVGRSRRRKKRQPEKEVVDLRGMLTQCAQAMANYDYRSATELLKKIRGHSSPHGTGTERLAFYMSNALEARMNGTGTGIFTVQISNNITAADMLKAYHMYIKASPFKIISNIYANKYIMKLAAGKLRLHVIDFGILYGFQWPCLIQGLSTRPGGPPKLRITGIDLPQPGFRPAERVEATGIRLKKYCEQFNVPFEFRAIAKKWETVKLEDLEIDREEVLAVNCLYRLENVPDETVVPIDSPRDAVLSLINRINPDIFIHGVGNGTYNTPFFMTRFREALFHFSTLFDMFEATVGGEDEDRRCFEETVLGRYALNVIACEGTERVERPETFKQWQVRNRRAGFRQVGLDEDLVKRAKDKVRADYHKDFSVDGDGKWLLQGWKGRVVYALSCWRPAH